MPDSLDRRALMQLGIVALGAGATVPAGAASLKADDPTRVTDVYARIRGNPGGALSSWWYGGTMFGKLDGEKSVPLLRVQGVGFNQFTPTEDGNVTQVVHEAGFFGDLETGEIKDEWTNPLTGAQTKIEHYKSLTRNVITPDGVETSLNPAVDFTGTIGPVVVNGDMAWVTENLTAKIPLPGDMGNIVSTYLSTFEAKIDDVENESLSFVPANTAFQSVTNFYPWMQMAGAPGEVIWQIMGRKITTLDDVPQAQRDRLDADHPGFLDDPEM
jgi:hypothetical protein